MYYRAKARVDLYNVQMWLNLIGFDKDKVFFGGKLKD